MTAGRDIIPVVDLFAGPGGLSEGFFRSNQPGRRQFSSVLAVEKESTAIQTLRLRTFYRRWNGKAPSEYWDVLRGLKSVDSLRLRFPKEWAAAEEHAIQFELGADRSRDAELDDRIRRALAKRSDWVLIGGPPCQAYSLVGRARNKGVANYRAEEDHRHFLYREYLRVIAEHQPAVFVMENVKGILTSKVAGEGIFAQILRDLVQPSKAVNRRAGSRYRVYSLASGYSVDWTSDMAVVDSRQFVVRAEEHGVPQKRHRVILLGVREDLDTAPGILAKQAAPTLADIIGHLPAIRSRLSKEPDSAGAWKQALRDALKVFPPDVAEASRRLSHPVHDAAKGLTTVGRLDEQWYRWDSGIEDILPQHSARSHMRADLARYLFAAAWAQIHGRAPRNTDFPSALAPEHRSWDSGGFADRFKTQIASEPGSTITSHIAKDGHYFIHFDPAQCRSLTVREAARVQTFSDDYFFAGNRTQQYVQVGNAVPPMLAAKIAELVRGVLEARQSGGQQ